MTVDSPRPVAPLSPDRMRLGPYRIVRELGQGGMGTVYVAEVAAAGEGAFGPLPPTGTPVALKCFHPHLVSSDDFEGRFRREAKVGAHLVHENLVHTIDAGRGELNGHMTSYLAMELVEGQTLRALIEDLGRLPEELATTIAQQVCEGLRAIHAAGITHRDLKPENVIVAKRAAPSHDLVAERSGRSTPDEGDRREGNVIVAKRAAPSHDLVAERSAGPSPDEDVPREGDVAESVDYVIKIMDLGVAKVRDASIRLSLTGQFLGSVHYAAPEQFRDTSGVDARADLYAVGILLHEMLTGQNPFYHSDLQVVLRRTLTETPVRVSHLAPEISPVLDQLVAALVSKSPDERPSTAAEVLDALQNGEESSWWRARGRDEWQRTGLRRARRIPVERETPLIGREEPMQRLRALFEKVAGGERHVVLLEGEAGVGKTRFLDELAAGLAEDGVDHEFTFATYPPSGTGRPYETLSEALLRLFEGEDVGAALRRHLSPGAPVEPFAALLEGRAYGGDILNPDTVRALFAECFRSIAAQRPLLLVIEDAHLAGESGASLLSFLARDDAASPILLVVSFRPLDDGHPLGALAQGGRSSRVQHEVLQRLGPREVGLLLRAALQSERLVQELGFRLLEKTEGNPYFMLEVLRSLKQEAVLKQRRDGSWTMGGTRIEIHVPDSVRELLHGVLARLPDEDRDVLDVACVVGMEFEPDLVGEVLGTSRLALLRRLSQMERKHRLIRSTGRVCRFDHQQLRETLYEELMVGLREEYHALIGEALERRRGEREATGPEALELARHLLSGRRLEQGRAHLAAALRHALTTYATEDCIALATRFLELDDDAGRTSPPELRVEALLVLAECLGHEGRRDEERVALESAAETVDATGDAALGRRTFERRLSLHFGLGEFTRAEVICRDAFRAATRTKDRTAAIAALGNLAGALRSQGRYDEAIDALRRALSWVVPEGSHLRRCLLTTSLGMVQAHRGHLDSAQRLYAQARSLAEGLGLGEGQRVDARRRGEGDTTFAQFQGLARALGRSAESRIDAERTLLLGTHAPQPVREAAALLAFGLLAAELGQLGSARAALLRARERASEAGDIRFETAIVQALGEQAVRAGDPELARRWFTESLELRRKIGYRPGVCESLLALGQVGGLAGDVEGARTCLDEALELAPELEMPGIAALARATAALLFAREGRRDRAREELAHAHTALGGEGPLSVASRAEGLYFAALAAKTLGDEETHSSYMWQAYDLVQEMAERMDPQQRHAFLTATSPNREIVAAVAG